MKLKHNKYFSILIAFLFCSFVKEKHIRVGRTVAKNFIKDFANPQGLEVFGFGGGMMGGTINRYIIDFNTEDYVDIDKAREKIVYLTENFLYYVNSSEAVQYLAKFPYDENDMDLGIGFIKPNELQFVDPQNIAQVNVYNGKVFYYIHNLDKQKLEGFYLESYAEAYEKVMGVPFSERNLLDFRCTCRNETEAQ